MVLRRRVACGADCKVRVRCTDELGVVLTGVMDRVAGGVRVLVDISRGSGSAVSLRTVYVILVSGRPLPVGIVVSW